MNKHLGPRTDFWPPRRRAQDGTDAEGLGHRAVCPTLPSVGLLEQPVPGARGSVVTRGFLETENPVSEPTDRTVSESPAPPQGWSATGGHAHGWGTRLHKDPPIFLDLPH